MSFFSKKDALSPKAMMTHFKSNLCFHILRQLLRQPDKKKQHFSDLLEQTVNNIRIFRIDEARYEPVIFSM